MNDCATDPPRAQNANDDVVPADPNAYGDPNLYPAPGACDDDPAADAPNDPPPDDATTTAVAAESADADPAPFDAVTRTRNVAPTSADATT